MNNFARHNPLQLGISAFGGCVALAPEERRRHLYVVGQTGTGKSTLLLNLIRQDLINGGGLCLLDPHGDLAEAVLAHVPRSRSNDLIYLNPADAERPIGFNPLAGIREEQKPVVADGIVAAFRHVWPDSWGPRLDYILTNAMRALLDVPGATLLMLPRLLIGQGFRLRTVERHVRDPMVRSFWLQEYESYADRFRTEAIAPIQNKIGKALMMPVLRKMRAYLSAHGARQHERQFGRKTFRVVTITTDAYRLKSMREALAKIHLPNSIGAPLFLFATRVDLTGTDPLAHPWLDGTGKPISLT